MEKPSIRLSDGSRLLLKPKLVGFVNLFDFQAEWDGTPGQPTPEALMVVEAINYNGGGPVTIETLKEYASQRTKRQLLNEMSPWIKEVLAPTIQSGIEEWNEKVVRVDPNYDSPVDPANDDPYDFSAFARLFILATKTMKIDVDKKGKVTVKPPANYNRL